jgi:3-methyladenine DNA glycosylase
MNIDRCPWAKSELDISYHDQEWGRPLHDDRRLFEMLILEGMQAGLSWSSVLKKREHMRRAFDGFEPHRLAAYDQSRLDSFMDDPGLIRNRAKLKALVDNARAFLRVVDEFGSFDAYLWNFVDQQPLINHWRTIEEVPAETETSAALSRDLKKRGFKFVGPVICYAYMQAVGLVNDHLVSCPGHPDNKDK